MDSPAHSDVPIPEGCAERLRRQLDFMVEIDRLKHINRRSYITPGDRLENSAEHSWHVAVMAMLLAEHSNRPVDTFKVVRMMLVHDLVEIDAGDTFCYDEAGYEDKAARENAAAERIFGLLPPDQGAEMRAIWDEFEEQATPEAAYAAGLDRLMPLLHNYLAKGRTWREHDVRARQVIDRNRHIGDGAQPLWEVAENLIRQAVANGYLAP